MQLSSVAEGVLKHLVGVEREHVALSANPCRWRFLPNGMGAAFRGPHIIGPDGKPYLISLDAIEELIDLGCLSIFMQDPKGNLEIELTALGRIEAA